MFYYTMPESPFLTLLVSIGSNKAVDVFIIVFIALTNHTGSIKTVGQSEAGFGARAS